MYFTLPFARSQYSHHKSLITHHTSLIAHHTYNITHLAITHCISHNHISLITHSTSHITYFTSHIHIPSKCLSPRDNIFGLEPAVSFEHTGGELRKVLFVQVLALCDKFKIIYFMSHLTVAQHKSIECCNGKRWIVHRCVLGFIQNRNQFLFAISNTSVAPTRIFHNIWLFVGKSGRCYRNRGSSRCCWTRCALKRRGLFLR